MLFCFISCKQQKVDPDTLIIDASTKEKYDQSIEKIKSKLEKENWMKFHIAVDFAFYVSLEERTGWEGFAKFIHNKTAGKMIRAYDKMVQKDRDWVFAQRMYWEKRVKQKKKKSR